MDLKDKIETNLKENKVQHEFISLPTDLPIDVEAHVKFHGITPKDAVPTLIYRIEKGLIAVQKRSDTKIDNSKLRNTLQVKKISMATLEDLQNLGIEVGAAPLTGYDFPVYIDKKVLDVETVYGGGGNKLFALKIRSEDLVKINKSQIVDVTSNEQSTTTRILSGITPSGSALHIGNFFGAVGPQIELQNKDYEVYYFVADLHALTTIQDRDQLENNIENVILDYLSLGLDPEKCVFFRQSQVPSHSQLAVVLANYVSYGQMQRMHAFKDKLQVGADEGAINMGLFNYPILMAADILLYKPSGVPVGEDQRQHIELTRDIADRFNKTYGQEVLPLPEPLISKETGKVVGTDGTRKMSKSLGNIIGIFEDEEIIKKQIMSAYTDPNRKRATDPGQIEGNTVFVYHDLINEDKQEVEELKDRYQKGEVGDVEVKEKLFEAHKKFFANARENRKELEANPQLLKKILKEGAQKAQKLANETLEEVYKVIGINNKLN